MKKLALLALVVAMTPAVGAKVWTSVYHWDGVTLLDAADPNHPTVYRDIMVGTRLVIVIGSDTKGPWSGGLLFSWDHWIYGELAARGYNEKARNYDGSCLVAAGARPFARVAQDTNRVGLQFNARADGVPGDWFAVDYHAKQLGSCDIGLYNWTAGFDVPIATLSFSHVPSRDFNRDSIVDFEDFTLLASHWGSAVHPDPNRIEAQVDLNADGQIDSADLALFSEYWLERTDRNEPNSPMPAPKPGA